jgi:UDP-N-acetylglucosamine 2-epimerase (non-hydrolysing)
MRNVTFVVGARPNFMKTAPVVRALRELAPDVEITLVHTGQHYDADMSQVFLDELGLPRPDVFLGVGSGTHGEQTAKALVGIEQVLRETEADMVVVPGDVNSTLAGALAGVKLRVPVVHLEAGLRSYDPEMPEEHNRRLTDHVSSLLLLHSESAIGNLEREGITEGIVLVGNTMIDSLVAHVDRAREAAPWREVGVEEGSYALVTLHRPALVDEPDLLRATAEGLGALAEEVPVVFPVHPRTRARIAESNLNGALGRVELTAPLPYISFLGLQAGARLVLTDSGGVQEETSWLGVRCFTLRDTTERPITEEQGTNTVIGARPERIAEISTLLSEPKPGSAIPLWDGRAGERAAAAILEALDAGEA